MDMLKLVMATFQTLQGQMTRVTHFMETNIFKVLDTQDLWVNTTYVQDALNYKWKHLIADTSNIPSDDNSSDTSNEAIGKWTGCYSQDTYCFRSSYNSIMAGDKDDSVVDWWVDGTRGTVTDYDPVDREAFVIKTWIQQGLHDISSGLNGDGSLVVQQSTKLNPNFYELRWYVNGEELADSRNASSVTVPDDNTFVSVAYRIVNVKEGGHVQVEDDINTFDDVYNSTFSTYTPRYYCDAYKTFQFYGQTWMLELIVHLAYFLFFQAVLLQTTRICPNCRSSKIKIRFKLCL